MWMSSGWMRFRAGLLFDYLWLGSNVKPKRKAYAVTP